MKALILKKLLLKPFISKKLAKLLARLHQISYLYLGLFATSAEGGEHPKHRLMKYHNFFVDNVTWGDTVLDVGCGNGILLKDIVNKTRASALGIELSENNVRVAREKLSYLPSVEIVKADIREFSIEKSFDTIVLSNVLEHIDRRTELLRQLVSRFRPKQILLRVPMLERDWTVPYKKELGIEWRLDVTHEIEYTVDEFYREMSEGGLKVNTIIYKWGEIWAVAVPLHENV